MMLARLFTLSQECPLSRFEAARRKTEAMEKAVDVPAEWSFEAAEAFEAALYPHAPAKHQAIEENTLPSWLWRHSAAHGAPAEKETSAHQVLTRVCRAAAYRGWKLGLWRTEKEAGAFHDEAFFLLTHRALALEPEALRGLGIAWAYGQTKVPAFIPAPTTALPDAMVLPNASVDAILATAPHPEHQTWDHWLQDGVRQGRASLRFSDAAAEWNPLAPSAPAPRLMLDLSRFCSDEGKVDVPALRHAVKIGVLLLEMHYADLVGRVTEARPVRLGYCNLAPLLMMLGLPYDGTLARTTAACLAAIIAAEATATSAELAELLGACGAFPSAREDVLRALRNTRRAAYGERNDYERLSIVPTPLEVEDGLDLVLLAAARRGWDEALAKVESHGLRHLQTTGLFSAPSLSRFLECAAEGIDPQAALVFEKEMESGSFLRSLPFFVWQGFQAAGLDPADSKAVANHLIGYGTLKGAPGVSAEALAARGLDDAALARIEEELPHARNIRTAVTPWIVGPAYCERKLGVTAAQLDDFSFDLLTHLGFSGEDIALADAFCCGHSSAQGVPEMNETQAAIFATADEISPLARIRMASAVQSFLAGDVGLSLSLSSALDDLSRAAIALDAWRHGLQSVSFFFEGPLPKAHAAKGKRKILQSKEKQAPQHQAFSSLEAPAVLAAPRASAAKAPSTAVSLKRAAQKTAATSKRR